MVTPSSLEKTSGRHTQLLNLSHFSKHYGPLSKHSHLRKRLPPFPVCIRHPQLQMGLLQLPMKPLILLRLPVRTGGIAKENPTPKRPDRMHPAHLPNLKRTPARIRFSPLIAQLPVKSRQFHRSHIKPMPKLIKPTAPPRHDTNRSPPLNLDFQIPINLSDPPGHINPARRLPHPIA
jgi:hypothetical protein